MLPRMATPRAPPISRVVSFMAEPMPAFSGGSDPMIDSVAGAMARPMPTPITTSTTATWPYELSTVVVENTTSPATTQARPAATTSLVPR